MRVIADDFRWRRPAGRKKGFAWRGTDGDKELVRLPHVDFVDYQPPPGLFRDFAQLGRKPEAVLAFANRYGELGEKTGGMEHLSVWLGHIDEFHKSVALADALDSGREADLCKALGALTDADRTAVAEALGVRPREMNLSDLGLEETIQAAAAHLGTVLLTRRMFFRGLTVQGGLSFGEVELRFQPKNLLAFMFFQFGVALVAKRKFRQCKHCGRWFRLGVVHGRSVRDDKETCSDSCRFQLYRGRQAQARELRAAAWTAKRIARELGAELSIVNKWLSQGKE
jgi:hypothetical protein